MLSIGIADIQKNTSIFSTTTEAFQIVDKRKKQILATVYPTKIPSVIEKLAGKYKSKIKTSDKSLNQIKEEAFKTAMREKYGLSA